MALFSRNRYSPSDLKRPASQAPGTSGYGESPYPGYRQTGRGNPIAGGMPTFSPDIDGTPTNPKQVGPSMQQVLAAGGTYNYSPQVGDGTAGGGRPATASYSLPLTGPTTPGQRAADDARHRAALESYSNRSSLINKLSGAMGGLQAAGGYGQSMPTGTSKPVAYPQVTMGAIPDASAAQSAAFGSAKAKAGAMGRSAVDSLRADLAERGILGGGTEARGLVDRLAAATNPLSELNVAQQAESLTDVRRTQELAAQRAAQEYGGLITQRGQDIQERQAQAQLAQQRQIEQMRLLQQALSGLASVY